MITLPIRQTDSVTSCTLLGTQRLVRDVNVKFNCTVFWNSICTKLLPRNTISIYRSLQSRKDCHSSIKLNKFFQRSDYKPHTKSVTIGRIRRETRLQVETMYKLPAALYTREWMWYFRQIHEYGYKDWTCVNNISILAYMWHQFPQFAPPYTASTD